MNRSGIEIDYPHRRGKDVRNVEFRNSKACLYAAKSLRKCQYVYVSTQSPPLVNLREMLYFWNYFFMDFLPKSMTRVLTARKRVKTRPQGFLRARAYVDSRSYQMTGMVDYFSGN